jgi:hypothetical protein
VALQVVDGDQGQAARQRHRLAEAQADHDPADQDRARRWRRRRRGRRSPARLAHARSVTPSIISTWLRAAISGTTPPKAAWSSIWEWTTEDRTVAVPSGVRRTTEAAVSSQLVSRPRTSGQITWAKDRAGIFGCRFPVLL